ncbi:hypothetical protein HanIR_Chr08g0378071 [Helianthus annuus]|nr:hypothetical protein HanIR_Chr08g0378071 [Helianthus annuus]
MRPGLTFPSPYQAGLYFESKINRSPSDHRLCCTRVWSSVVAETPRNASRFGL